MLTIETLKTYIEDKKEDLSCIEVKPRETSLEGSVEFVTSLYGPRRAGKSYLFYSLFKDSSDVLYLNFDDIQLNDWTAKDIVDSVALFREAYRKDPRYILLDEVQRIAGWETAVVTLYERKRYKIFLTGSSSRLLAKEIASSLRGRTTNHVLLPLSFREYLDFKGIDHEDLSSTRKKSEIRSMLEDYLLKGCFPGILQYPGPHSKFYEEYIDLVLYRDLVERYGLTNTGILRFLQKSIINSQSKEFSVNKLYKTWKSMRYEASKRTFYEYFGHLEEVMFALPLYKYHDSERTSELSPPKVYLPDPAIGSVLGGIQIGRLMENCVFLHLLRMQQKEGGKKLFFWKDRGREIDFVITRENQISEMIQVTYALSENNMEREHKGFEILNKQTSPNVSKKIITWTGEEKISQDVDILPLWKFLLDR
ncbi:MAG: ATP-binding protein [Candidatus Thermoplasmatota archaeon]|nr:ATP-binding protein [Candidatus Thermoplasmatota archaeon]